MARRDETALFPALNCRGIAMTQNSGHGPDATENRDNVIRLGHSNANAYTSLRSASTWKACAFVDENAYMENVAVQLEGLRRGRLNWSMDRMAKALGYAGQSGYQRWEDEATWEGKGFPFHFVVRLIKAVENQGDPPITLAELLSLAENIDKALLDAYGKISAEDRGGVPVEGIVAAGVWREHEDHTFYSRTWPAVPACPDARFANMRQFAVLVEGPSVNKVIPSGDFAICVNFADAMRDIREGDLAVIQRTRDSAWHEYTIKRVRGDRDRGFELWPESTDDRFQAPLALSELPEHMEIKVIGLAIARYRPF